MVARALSSKAEEYGFLQSDDTPEHDAMVMRLCEIEETAVRPFAQSMQDSVTEDREVSEWDPTEIEDYRYENDPFRRVAFLRPRGLTTFRRRVVGCSEPVPRPSVRWEAPIMRDRRFLIGNVDVMFTYGQWEVACEVKPRILSVGSLLRQVGKYREHGRRVVVVSADARFDDVIRSQGYGFIHIPHEDATLARALRSRWEAGSRHAYTKGYADGMSGAGPASDSDLAEWMRRP